MKSLRYCLTYFLILFVCSISTKGIAQDVSQDFYVLQIYTLANEEQEALTDYLFAAWASPGVETSTNLLCGSL